MAASHKLGRLSEDLAVAWLERLGYAIVARNFRSGHREIDLIVRRECGPGLETVVAFVEVKARSGAGWGHPLEGITWAKRVEVERAARGWIERHGRPDECYRFDAVAVVWSGGSSQVTHVPDAWRRVK